MAAPADANAALAVFKLVEKIEIYVKKYFERRDLVDDNRERLSLLQEMYDNAFEDMHTLENTSLHTVPSCDAIIGRRLHEIRSLLETNRKKLNSFSNSAYEAGVTSRVKRMRDTLEECWKHVTEFAHFLRDTVIPSLEKTAGSVTHTQESYVPDSNVPPNPPRLTLDYNTTNTFEGRLKAAIIEGSSSGIVGVVASGLGGVGKTCALRGLAKDPDIKHRFPGGVLYIQLGNDARISDIINGVARAVERTGGERLARAITGLRTVQDASDKAARWFRPQKCLFLVDDIWWVNGIASNVFSVLGTMLHDESLLVYTTRDKRFLRGADTEVHFEVREAHGELAHRMLMTHAGFDSVTELSPSNSEAFKGILNICNGLPLALGIAGAAVLKYSENRDVDHEDAWTDYYEDLRTKEESIIDGNAEQYGPLRLIVDSSLGVLESEKGFEMTFEDMFRGFCVLRKHQKVGGHVLQKLWDLEITKVRQVAELFDGVSLVLLTTRRRNSFCVQLHDLILDIAMRKASERYEVKAWFSHLVENYMPREQETHKGTMQKAEDTKLSKKRHKSIISWARKCFRGDQSDAYNARDEREGEVVFRPWWTIKDDGFIRDNLCRVLQGAGEGEELLWLLERAQWIVLRLQTGGIFGIKQDIGIGKHVAKKTSDADNALRYLKLVGRAARMSCVSVANNSYEAWFQLYGRLVWFAEHCDKTKCFLSEIEKHAPLPWAKPSVGILEEAGSAALETIKTEGVSELLCVSHTGDLIRILWIDRDDVIFVTEYDKKHGSQQAHRLGSVEIHRDSHGGLKTYVRNAWPFWSARYACGSFSGSLNRVVTGHDDGKILLWNVEGGYRLERCLESPGTVRCVGISGDGKTIASGSLDGGMRLWNTDMGESVENTLEAHRGVVECVAVSLDGKRIVSSSVKGNVHIWDETGQELQLPQEVQNDCVHCVAISGDGGRVVSGSVEGIIRVWDVEYAEVSVMTMRGHSREVLCVAISHDGRRVVSGSSDNTVRVWDTESGVIIGKPFEGHTFRVSHVALSSDGNEIVSISFDGSIRVWNVGSTDAADRPERFADRVHCIAYCGHGNKIVSGSDDGCVRVWDLESGEIIGKPLYGHKGRIRSVAVSRSGNMIASRSTEDDTVLVWDTNGTKGDTQPLSIAREDETATVDCIALSNDGMRVVISSKEGIDVRDTGTGKLTGHLDGPGTRVWSIAMSSNRKRIAGGLITGRVFVWDVDRCALAGPPLAGHREGVWSISWSENGERLASGSEDRTVRVWDLASREELGKPLLHDSEVFHVESHVACSQVVSYDEKGFGRLWDVRCEKSVMTSSDATWRSTLQGIGIASFEWLPQRREIMKITGKFDTKTERVLASSDRGIVRVGDLYFSNLQSSVFWPFCRVVR